MDYFCTGSLVSKQKEMKGKSIVVIENGLISTYTMRDGLMKELMNNGYEVTVLTHANHNKEKVEKTGIKVVDVGSGNVNPIKILRYIYKLYIHLKKIKPDICLTFSVRPAIWGNLTCRALSIPVITNITGTGPLFESQNIAYKVIRRIYPFALKKTKKVFFQNDDDKNLFIQNKFVSEDKTGRIPGSGVDYEKFDPSLYNIRKNGQFIFLFIGRLIIDKGILEYIEAAKQLKEKYPEIKFKLIGPFWHQNLKLNQVSRSIIDNMVESGVIEYSGEKTDVREDIAGADCIVLPSYREGTSNVLLESASMEKPIVTTDVPGCREIVEDGINGFLCKPRDADDLADKMEKMFLTSESERKTMGENGRRKVIQEFDKKIVVRSYLKAINDIIGSS